MEEDLGVHHPVWSLIIQAEQLLVYFIGTKIFVEAIICQERWDGCNLHQFHCFLQWNAAG
eukprot:9492079-Ditylum_brightwellii.AAC.1